MKHVLLSSLCFGAGLLLSGAALAQSAPPPVPVNQQAHPPTNNTTKSPVDTDRDAMQPEDTQSDDDQKVIGSTTFTSSKGAKVTINSQTQAPPEAGPPPAFSKLAGASGHSITRAEASAYPPLANDFEYADSNKNGRISKAEYTRWKNH